MKKHIELHKRKVPYTLKVSRKAKRLRLSVYCDGAFVVTTPRNLQSNVIERFIIKKSQWVLDKIDYFSGFANSFKVKNTKADFLKHKETAQKLAEMKVAKFNKIYKFGFNKINIKNQKTRWGSCSKKGNLNFNYKLLFLPEKVRDYIVVHELCHLKEFNHSRKFWNLVAQTFPDHREIKTELRKHSMNLQ